MEINWSDELMRQAQEIMIKGGELRFKVIVRGKDRLPEINSYPGNFIRCKTETLAE